MTPNKEALADEYSSSALADEMTFLVRRLRNKGDDASADLLQTYQWRVREIQYRAPTPDALTEAVGLLRDANVVHVNMLRGGIAKPTPEQVGHLYRGDPKRAAKVIQDLQAEIAGLREHVRRLDVAMSWVEPPFVDDDTPESEIRDRIRLMLDDAKPGAKSSKTVRIGRRSVARFLEMDAEDDGTLRCISCGQIDEQPWHKPELCFALAGLRAEAVAAPQASLPPVGEVREVIWRALRKYALTNMDDGDGFGVGYPLVDLMSNDGTTIATGEAEMRVLADHISEALGEAAASPSDQSDTERLRALLSQCRSELAIRYVQSAGALGIVGTYPELAEKYGGSDLVAKIDAALAEKEAGQ